MSSTNDDMFTYVITTCKEAQKSFEQIFEAKYGPGQFDKLDIYGKIEKYNSDMKKQNDAEFANNFKPSKPLKCPENKKREVDELEKEIEELSIQACNLEREAADIYDKIAILERKKTNLLSAKENETSTSEHP